MPSANDPGLLDIKPPARSIPPVALAFGQPDCDATYVDAGHPLPVRAAGDPSLIERLSREGEGYSSHTEYTFSSFAAPTGAGTTVGSGGIAPVPKGHAVFVQNVHISSTTPIAFRVWAGGSELAGISNVPKMDIGATAGPNYSATIPVNIFVRSSMDETVAVYIKRWLDPNVTGTHYVQVSASGFLVADAINFEAEKVIGVFGDSIFKGATGPTTVEKHIPWLVNRFYRDRGIDSRYLMRTYSGFTTGNIETFRKRGRFDFRPLDLLLYNLGANDAGGSFNLETSMANIAAFVDWKQKLYPGASLVLFGPTPAENNTTEANLVTLRAAIGDYVEELGDPKVLFCDLGGAFDRTVSGNYASSDSAGSRVHPDDDGNGFVWNGGYNGFAGLKSWLETHLPAI